MYKFLLVLLALGVLAPPKLRAAEIASPTVIVDIHALGFEKLADLKSAPGVRWSAEFGNELLMGVAPENYSSWLNHPRAKAGLGNLALDEILVRDHVCTHASLQPALGIVGGYEIMRLPPALARYARLTGLNAQPLPESRVMSRESLNEPDFRRAPSTPDPIISRIVGKVNADRWYLTMSGLSLFNRNSFSPNLSASRDWILSQFASANLTTSVFNFTLSNITSCSPLPAAIELTNPIGTKLGRRYPDEWIVVGGHYDSRNSSRCDGVFAPQPGANDNASGCAAVIELATAMLNVPTDRTILFMCFSGEEQGLVGSRRYVESLQASGQITRVKQMINLDMIGFDVNGTRSARVETNATFGPLLLPRFRQAALTYAPELNLITSQSPNPGSDHWHFLAAGVPAVFTWENGAAIYPHYHQATDLPENMTGARALAGGIIKMDAAMLAEFAGVEDLFLSGFEQ